MIKSYFDTQTSLVKVHLDRNFLDVNQFYNLTFKAAATNSTRYVNMQGGNGIQIYIGNPPSGGKCVSDKLKGKPLQTVFNLSAPDWTDENGIQEYSF